MPAFYTLLRHHLPRDTSIISYLSTFRKRRRASTHATAHGTYSNLDPEVELGKVGEFRNSQLNKPTEFKVHIAGHSGSTMFEDPDDEGIHLEREIQQTWSHLLFSKTAQLAPKNKSSV